MKAEKLEDGQIRMTSGAWFDVFPESKLASWIEFYDKMHSDCDQPKYKEWADTLRTLR